MEEQGPARAVVLMVDAGVEGRELTLTARRVEESICIVRGMMYGMS